MNWQDIISYLILAGALFFLAKKFVFKKKKKNGSCNSDNCGCS